MSTISVHLPESLERATREVSREENCTLQQFVLTAIAEKVAAVRTVSEVEHRALRANDKAFLAVLGRIERHANPLKDKRDQPIGLAAEMQSLDKKAARSEES